MNNHSSLVSILLPNLNTRPFLEERMATILNQTYSNWELIIADSYSEDGSWEYLSRFPAEDSRITAYQIPRGLYQAWNFCLEKAKGEYIYIATSDDTMIPECIEKMVSALEAHPECDICDSALGYIDESGHETTREGNCFVDYARDREHIRTAPHDGLLSLAGLTVYCSITQIMFRRKLLQKTGMFSTAYGPQGDYQWGMYAGFAANVIYLPQKLSSWRVRKEQATVRSEDAVGLLGAKIFLKHVAMAEECVFNLQQSQPQLLKWLKPRKLLKVMRFRKMLLIVTGDFPLTLKLKNTCQYFLQYPEELLIYPYLFMKKRLFRLGDLSLYRTYHYINEIKEFQQYFCTKNENE